MIEESPLANSPAKPPLSPTHIHSTWWPTQGLQNLSILPMWGGVPLGDPQNPITSPSRWQVGWGPWLLTLGWAGPWLPPQLS